ncbi:MAG: hypothetical protein ACSHX0_06785 [Akkermansiaceae bacterium]
MSGRKTIEAEVMDAQFNGQGVTDVLGWSALDGVKTPDQEAMEREELGFGAEDVKSSNRDALRAEVLFVLFSYFLRDFLKNGSALDVGKRVIGMASLIGHRSLGGMSASQLAKACGEAREVMTQRVGRECHRIIKAMSGVIHVKSQPDSSQRAAHAHSQSAFRAEDINVLLAYFLRDFLKNGSVLDVGKRVIGMAKFIEHRALDGLSATQLSKACDETPATMSERVKRECNKVIKTLGGVAQAKWQQGPSQRATSARAQMGNNNRVKNLKSDKKRMTLEERRGK